ncbi:MAG: hypothetical protein V4714_02045 [Bacteroidota bacterium]
MQKIVLVLFLFIFSLPSIAQTVQPPKDITTLLAERDKLYKEYIYYKDQKSSFWGTQSKNDLRQVIDILKGIISKDSELVELVRVQGLRKESSYIGQSREITDRIYALNEEAEKLQVQLGKQRKQLAETKEELAHADNSSSSFKILSLVLALVVAGLIFYIRKIR